MSDALSFVEIDGQCLELLPARTVLSVVGLAGGLLGNQAGDGGGAASSGDSVSQSGDAQNVQKPAAGDGGNAQGGGIIGGLGGIAL